MTKRQAAAFLKEWGVYILAGMSCVSSLLLAIAIAAGFGTITPAKLFAQLEQRVAALERDRPANQAVLRFLCNLDREKAYLSGINCDQLGVR